MRRWLPIVVGVVLALALLVFAFWRTLGVPLNLPTGGALVQVQPGASVRQVAHDLARRGILQHPRLWSLYAAAMGQATHIKQGQYRLTKGLTAAGLLDLLVAGRTVQYSFTLVDGWTLRQILQALNRDPHVKHTLSVGEHPHLIGRLGGPADMAPEGWFYPDTYFFPDGASDVSILRRAYDAMRHYLDAQWTQRASGLPLHTPYQALILASMVEKETARARERPLIAGVFINRLRLGMRLQSDPTVIYGLGRSFSGDITFKDLRRDTPYNTYVHFGLPPTPIAVPSPAAIHAVLHPAHTDYLYFVSKGNGAHVFSRTYAQQRREVDKYQLGERSAAKRDVQAASKGN